MNYSTVIGRRIIKKTSAPGILRIPGNSEEYGINVGTICLFGGSIAPNGWLLCQGQGISTSTYSNLFSIIGYTFGGNSGTFYLPDYRGRFEKHLNGESLGSVDTSNSSHTHSITWNNSINNHSVTQPSIGVYNHYHGTSSGNFRTYNDGAHSHQIWDIYSTTSDGLWQVAGAPRASGASSCTTNSADHSHANGEVTGYVGNGTVANGSNNNTAVRSQDFAVSNHSMSGHNSTVTSSTDSTLPPYINLNYIIKY
jgi:microcystin-dependent protein